MRSRGWFGRAVVDPAVKTPHAASWLDRLAARADSFVCPRSSHGLPPDLPRNEAWITRLCWAFVVFGLLVRLVRFLVVYPIWHDEAFLAVNFLDRGYRDLLRPLDYAQVAPVWYLWIELTAVRLFGFSEWSLRLFAAICGLASVLVFRHLASRVLRGAALLLAVAVFATAFHPIRHSAEVKPYASDLLASLLLMTLAVEWWRFPGRSRWLWALAALVPMLLAVSYPAVLVAAAVSLALAPEALRSTHRPVRLAFLTYNIVLAGSFLALYFSFTVVQSTALLSFYRQGWWRDSFPPLGQPWKVPAWLVSVHTGTMMGYPIGEKAGGSTVTFLAAILGGLVVWKAKQPTILRLVTFPFLIGLAASCLGRYPYGGPARVSQYLVPSIILLSGLGGAVLIALRVDMEMGQAFAECHSQRAGRARRWLDGPRPGQAVPGCRRPQEPHLRPQVLVGIQPGWRRVLRQDRSWLHVPAQALANRRECGIPLPSADFLQSESTLGFARSTVPDFDNPSRPPRLFRRVPRGQSSL